MSAIDELSELKCETCGSGCIQGIWRNDGEFWNRTYDFGCGFGYVHRGHDGRIMARANCENAPWLVARKQARIAATESLLQAVKALAEVDEAYRKELTDMLNSKFV